MPGEIPFVASMTEYVIVAPGRLIEYVPAEGSGPAPEGFERYMGEGKVDIKTTRGPSTTQVRFPIPGAANPVEAARAWGPAYERAVEKLRAQIKGRRDAIVIVPEGALPKAATAGRNGKGRRR